MNSTQILAIAKSCSTELEISLSKRTAELESQIKKLEQEMAQTRKELDSQRNNKDSNNVTDASQSTKFSKLIERLNSLEYIINSSNTQKTRLEHINRDIATKKRSPINPITKNIPLPLNAVCVIRHNVVIYLSEDYPGFYWRNNSWHTLNLTPLPDHNSIPLNDNYTSIVTETDRKFILGTYNPDMYYTSYWCPVKRKFVDLGACGQRLVGRPEP